MHYCTSKHSFLIYDFQETTPLQWRKSYVLNENKKLHIFKQWVSQTMQNRMVPSLENYFFTSKTNLDKMNFILKLRSFKKKKERNSYLLKWSQVETCFCAAKLSSISAEELVKILVQSHYWNPPEMALLFKNPHKIFDPCCCKTAKVPWENFISPVDKWASSETFFIH